MAQYKDVAVGSIVYFWFAANTSTGTAGDGASPTYAVRLAGAAASAAAKATGVPTLLTSTDYSDGSFEIAIDTTGYTAGAEYAVFCSLLISAVNPNGFVGSFKVRAAASTLYELVQTILADILAGVPIGTGGITSLSFALNAITDLAMAASADNEIANALLDLVDGIETGLTPRNALRLLSAVLAGRVSGGGTGTETFRNAIANTKNRLVVTDDAHGNRTNVVVDLT